MNISEFKNQLRAHPEAHVAIALPDGSNIPAHFHVTEVGHVAKEFVDCGGKFRGTESCVLQIWMAGERDDGHRLTAGKLSSILGFANSILPSDELPVEVEYEDGMISQFPVAEVTLDGPELTVRLGSKHTDCLARERCGASGEGACTAEEADESSCSAGAGGSSGSGCCQTA